MSASLRDQNEDRHQSKIKRTVLGRFLNNVEAEYKENSTKNNRGKIKVVNFYNINVGGANGENNGFCPFCKNKFHRPKHRSHIIKSDPKDVEGWKRKVFGEGIAIHTKENVVEKIPFSSSSGEMCPKITLKSNLSLSTDATSWLWKSKKRAKRSDPTSDKNGYKRIKKSAFPNQDNSDSNLKRKYYGEASSSPSHAQEKSLVLTTKESSLVIFDEENLVEHRDLQVISDEENIMEHIDDFDVGHLTDSSGVIETYNFDPRVALKIASNSKGKDIDRNATPNDVRGVLSQFRSICKSLNGLTLKKDENSCRRIDLKAATMMREMGVYISKKPAFGDIDGINVNDTFHYRMELAIVGLHRPPQSGIDYVSQYGQLLATSIVASGGYDNDVRHSDDLIYTGQGGNIVARNKEPEDQVLMRGNLALKNSIKAKNPIRVIRRISIVNSLTAKTISSTYIYDGLYQVSDFWNEVGTHKKLVYKFWLNRIPGQPKLIYKKSEKHWQL